MLCDSCFCTLSTQCPLSDHQAAPCISQALRTCPGPGNLLIPEHHSSLPPEVLAATLSQLGLHSTLWALLLLSVFSVQTTEVRRHFSPILGGLTLGTHVPTHGRGPGPHIVSGPRPNENGGLVKDKRCPDGDSSGSPGRVTAQAARLQTLSFGRQLLHCALVGLSCPHPTTAPAPPPLLEHCRDCSGI